MTKHTPHPWHWESVGGREFQRLVSDTDDDLYVLDVDGDYCDDMWLDVDPEDAHLLRASPDLLAACEAAIDILRNAPGGHGHVIDMMEAAIKKASGQS